MTRKALFLILITLFLMVGCESQQITVQVPSKPEETQPAKQEKQPTFKLLSEPIEASLMESATEALPFWSHYRAEQPALVILSNDPFLKPFPKKLQDAISELIDRPAEKNLSAELNPFGPDPLLLPPMALSAALQNNLFSRVIWVISGKESFKEQEPEAFAQHLAEYGAINANEILTFKRDEHGFSGQVHNRPFSAVHETSLPSITEPVLLHIDLSYFKPVYKGEIKTPLYELLYQTMKQLRSTNMSTLAVSISHSNLSGNLPLSTRFIGANLTRLFSNPELLDSILPKSWEIRRKTLYLENFFQKEKVHELAQQLKTSNPQDASTGYTLYKSLRELKKGTEALNTLAEATQIDPVYGLEYLSLSTTAMEKKRPDQALKMLDLAIAAFPENPFIQLQKAELLIQLGHASTAEELLKNLQQLLWSEVYYPQLPDYINSLLTESSSATE